MPNKHNQDRRHHIAKKSVKATNMTALVGRKFLGNQVGD